MRHSFLTKNCLVLFVIIMLLCTITGCSGSNKDENNTLTVYYLKEHPYYGAALGEYNISQGQKEMELEAFESADVMISRLTTEIAVGKGPDVVLMDSGMDFDIYKAIRAGAIAELGSYFEMDEKYHSDNYFSPIMEGGKTEGKQYIIPFTFGLDTLYVDEGILDENAIDIMSIDDYESMLGLLDKLSKSDIMDKVSFAAVSRGGMQDNVYTRFLCNSGTELIAEGKVNIDTELLTKISNYLLCMKQEQDAKISSLNPNAENVYDTALAISSNGNYPIMRQMVKGLYEKRHLSELYAAPWKNVNGKNQPFIHDFGFVNSKSDNISEAYQLLRYLMDYETPFGGNSSISICRENVDRELESLSKTQIVAFKSKNGDNIMSVLLDEDTEEEIRSELEHMDMAKLTCNGYYKIVTDFLEGMQPSENIDFIELENSLKRYLNE